MIIVACYLHILSGKDGTHVRLGSLGQFHCEVTCTQTPRPVALPPWQTVLCEAILAEASSTRVHDLFTKGQRATAKTWSSQVSIHKKAARKLLEDNFGVEKLAGQDTDDDDMDLGEMVQEGSDSASLQAEKDKLTKLLATLKGRESRSVMHPKPFKI